MVVWLQSSGDPVADRDLLERRLAVPLDEPADGALGCATTAAIVPRLRSGDDAPSALDLDGETLNGQRIAGQINIFPADAVKDAIHANGGEHFVVPVKICVDEGGHVAAVTLLSPSGYTGYDMDLLNGVASWRYRPFRLDGKPARACGIVNFDYRQSRDGPPPGVIH